MAQYEQVHTPPYCTAREPQRTNIGSISSASWSRGVLAAWFLASGSLATCIGKQALAPCVAADALMLQGAKRVMRACNQRAASSVVRTSVQSSAAAKWLGHWTFAISSPAAVSTPRRSWGVLPLSLSLTLTLALALAQGPRMASPRLQQGDGSSSQVEPGPTRDPRIAPPSDACTAAAKALAATLWTGYGRVSSKADGAWRARQHAVQVLPL